MKRKNFYRTGNDDFICGHCGRFVAKLSGGFRNHCPYCLWSRHVDVVAGDRLEVCRGLMEPIAIDKQKKKGWVITHQCMVCSTQSRNKIAVDDDWDLVINLM